MLPHSKTRFPFTVCTYCTYMSKNKNMVTYSYIEITVHQQSKLYRLEAVKIKTNRELNPV